MNSLVRVTYGFGILLIILGIGAYLLSSPDSRSATAFIPTVIGILLLVAGWGTTNPQIGRMSGIAAVVLVLFLALGSIRGLVSFINAFVSNSTPTVGQYTQVLIMILSVLYLGFAFMHIRKQIKSKRAETAS